jgi:hypothetical protein
MRLFKHALILTLLASGCIFPDIEIVVYATQECGDQYRATTSGASGVNGLGDQEAITTIDDEPIVRIWCLTPEQSALMQFPDSWIYLQLQQDVVAACHERAIELGLGQTNCVAMATVAYAGTCAGKHEWCESGTDDEATGEDEVGMPTDMPR